MSKIFIPLITALLLSACGLNSESGVSSNDGEAKTTAEQNIKTPSIGLSSEPSIGKSVFRLHSKMEDMSFIFVMQRR